MSPDRRRRNGRPAGLVRYGFADRTALAGISEANIISKPFVGNEHADKVRLATGSSGNVVRLRR
jgi:hypothetical protein